MGPHGDHRSALITGTTGFVGGELLAHLLQISDRTFVCPVRADSADAAAERGARRLIELLGADALAHATRITWLPAQLTQDHFGWSTEQWHRVAAQITEVFHCAAAVSFNQGLAEAHEINVVGTQNAFALAEAAAADHRFHRFHHVSTAYVAGLKAGLVGPGFLPTDEPGNFRNTYERTKARAERWLRPRARAGLPVTVHRPSIICGHSETGATNSFNVIYGPMKRCARGQLPIFPCRGPAILDSIGVDLVVQAMGVFAATDSAPLEHHYLAAGPTAFNGRDLLAATVSAAQTYGLRPSRTRLLTRAQWQTVERVAAATHRMVRRVGPALPRRVVDAVEAITTGVDNCDVFVPYAFVETIFDTAYDHQLLSQHGVVVPHGLGYLNTIVGYAIATNFGKDVVPRASSDSLRQQLFALSRN